MNANLVRTKQAFPLNNMLAWREAIFHVLLTAIDSNVKISNNNNMSVENETQDQFYERIVFEVYMPAMIAMGATALSTLVMNDIEAIGTGLSAYYGLHKAMVSY